MLTNRQIEARIEAFNEAVEHLGMRWTEDDVEREQGNIVAEFIRTQGEKWHKNATKNRQTVKARLLKES